MKDIKLKNRTSVVAPEKTSERIEKILVEAGANDIRKRYENSKLIGVDFSMQTDLGLINFRIPVHSDRAYEVMLKQRTRYANSSQKRALFEQAERTAWKMAQEWLEIQLSMVAMKQVEFVQALLTYAVRNDGTTFFDVIKADGLKMLASRNELDDEVVDAG